MCSVNILWWNATKIAYCIFVLYSELLHSLSVHPLHRSDIIICIFVTLSSFEPNQIYVLSQRMRCLKCILTGKKLFSEILIFISWWVLRYSFRTLLSECDFEWNRHLRYLLAQHLCPIRLSYSPPTYYLTPKSQLQIYWRNKDILCVCVFLSLDRAFWYSHSSFTNRCTFIKTLITIYIKIRWLLRVSVYDHHQGACNWAWLSLYWY